LYPGGFNVSGCVNDGSIDLSVTGGNLGYTYLWSNGATTQDISGLAAGTYSVTITDLNGCQTTNSFTLVGPNPMVTSVSATTYASGTNISCFGASDGFVDLVVNGGTPNYSYLWSNGATTQDLSNVPVGTYSVTITDANGCQTNETITLTQPVVLASSLSPSVYAGGFNVSGCVPDGEINLTVTGGNPGYSFLWSNGFTSEDLTNLPAGTYTVTVTDINGCQTVSNITLTQPGDLTETISATTFPSGTNISCFGASDGNIDLTPNGGTPGYTYLWSNGATTQDLNNVPAGTYGVIITDQNGCQVSSSITLIQPPVLNQSSTAFTYPSGSNISCFGLSNGSIDLTVIGGNPGYSYLWNTGATTQDISGLAAGTYTVTVTDLNACTVNTNITLVQPTQLTGGLVPSVYAGGVNVSGCVNDGTIDLTVNGGSPIYTYLWSNGATSQDLSALAAGTYSVTVTDLNGCQATQNITLTGPTPLSQSISAFVYSSGTNISCFGASDGSVDLTINGGVGPYNYVWSNGASSQDLTNVPAGTYNVVVTDALGCQITSSITLDQPPSLSQTIVGSLYPSGTNISCFGATDGSVDLTIAGGNPGYSYLWSNGATTEDLTGVPAGTYSVVATDPNGCTINSTITLVQPIALSIDLSALQFIGGNNVSCTGASDGSIDLTVAGGSPVYTYNWSNGGTNQDITSLSAGTYSVTVTDVNGCQIGGNIILTEPTLLNYSATLTTVAGGFNVSACADNGSIDVSVSGSTPNYSYVWNNGSTSQDLNNLAGGTYSVIITDVNGCTISFDTTLTVAPIVTGIAQVSSNYNGQDVSCFGASDGSVNATPTTGVPTYTYQWLNAANQPVGNTPAVSGLLAGTYTVVITDANGCTGTTTVTLVNPPAIASSAVVSTNYNGQDISCFGASDGGVDLTVNGGTPGYGYVWINSQGTQISTNQDLSGLPVGTYAVVVTDANGCTSNTSISLTQPPLLIGVADVLSDYNGADVSCFSYTDGLIGVVPGGGTPGYTYQWFTSSGNSLGSGVNQPNVGQGNYSVIVTDVNGCAVTAPVVVTQPSELIMAPIITSNYFGNQVSCVGATDGVGYIFATGGTPSYTYNWGTNPVLTTQNVTTLGEGTFNVVVTDMNGCTDNAQITLTANPLPTSNLPPPIFGCIGSEVVLQSNSSPETNCQWTLSNGAVYNECGPISLTFENGACLDAQLVISTSLGCADTLSLTNYICVAPNPVASFTISEYELTSTNFDAFFYNNSQGADTYYWDFGDNTNSTVENPYHQFPQSGYENFTIWLYAYSDLGCVDSTVRYINFTEDLIIYVPNTFTPDYDEFNNTFFPVLSSGFNPSNFRLYIFNRWGELIFESRDHTVGWDGTYNGDRCQVGTYVWKIVTMDSQTDRKREFVGHVNLIR
jgi:gliding motility-associated-like protein